MPIVNPICKKCKGQTQLSAVKATHEQYKCPRCRAVMVVMNKKGVEG